MATIKDKLYDAFGELVYVLAMSDGELQTAELEMLKDLLSEHKWAKQIQWSFNYEKSKSRDLEDVYKKVKYACLELGPQEEYKFMIEVLEKVAESSLGIVKEEQDIIDEFRVFTVGLNVKNI